MMIDLAEIKTGNITLEIRHPKTDEPLGVFVTLQPIDSPSMKKMARNINDRKLTLQARGKNFKSEEMIEIARNLTIEAIVDWEWAGQTFEGEVLEFNRKNVSRVIEKLDWFRDQIDDELGNVRSFF